MSVLCSSGFFYLVSQSLPTNTESVVMLVLQTTMVSTKCLVACREQIVLWKKKEDYFRRMSLILCTKKLSLSLLVWFYNTGIYLQVFPAWFL